MMGENTQENPSVAGEISIEKLDVTPQAGETSRQEKMTALAEKMEGSRANPISDPETPTPARSTRRSFLRVLGGLFGLGAVAATTDALVVGGLNMSADSKPAVHKVEEPPQPVESLPKQKIVSNPADIIPINEAQSGGQASGGGAKGLGRSTSPTNKQ